MQDKEYKEVGHYTKRPVRATAGVMCDNYKPLHHHAVPAKLVWKTWYHCPWMNVRKENHKFFMLFLLYVGLGLAIHVMTGIRLYMFCQQENGEAEAKAFLMFQHRRVALFDWLYCQYHFLLPILPVCDLHVLGTVGRDCRCHHHD